MVSYPTDRHASVRWAMIRQVALLVGQGWRTGSCIVRPSRALPNRRAEPRKRRRARRWAAPTTSQPPAMRVAWFRHLLP
jgi:hypothetical protein